MANRNEDQWCFAWLQRDSSAGRSKAALLKAARWNPGNVVTVCFLDGKPAVQKRVQEAAETWTGKDMANLRLSFVKKHDAAIRISFQLRGSWSSIGTTCRNVPAGQPTMNFGWLTEATPADELRRVVLHEFGHALGLIHEHQNPTGGIRWNRKNVVEDLSGPPNNWTKQQIETNMFQAFKKQEVNSTRLDEKSIMLYPIPARWTTNGFSSVLNTTLSPGDIKFIRSAYPWT